jgi:AcrR family transcriptional regulator
MFVDKLFSVELLFIQRNKDMPRTKEAFEAMRHSTRQKIETGALSLFVRKGLSVKVGEIAEASGVSQGLLYSHYPSKDALIAELTRQAITISSQFVMGASKSGESAAMIIKNITNMMCGMFKDAPIGIDYFMFMAQVGMSGLVLDEMVTFSEEFPNPAQILAGVITRGQVEGSVVSGCPLQLSIVYWATIQGLCSYAITGMPVLPEQIMLNRILLKENYL